MSNSRTLAARARAKSPQEKASITAFEVAPRIFCIRFWPALAGAQHGVQTTDARLRGPQGALLTAIGRLEGVVYRMGDPVFFGFPRLPGSEALTCALAARRECVQHAPESAEVALSCSTVGLRKYADVLTRPWEFLGSPELSDALTAGVRFNRMEPM